MYASFSRHNVCCTHVFKGVCDPRVYIHRKIYIYILYVRFTAAVARDSAFSAQLCSVALQSSSNTTWHADATVLTQTAKWTGPIQVCESMARYYLPWDDLRGLHLQSMKCQEVIRRVNSKKIIYISTTCSGCRPSHHLCRCNPSFSPRSFLFLLLFLFC